MPPFSRLRELARRASDDPDAALDQVLALACELLGMERAVLGPVDGEVRTVERAVGPDGRRDHALETSFPADAACCAHVGPEAPLLVVDVAADPPVAHVLAATGGAVASCVGTRLDVAPDPDRGGEVVLGLVRSTRHERLGPWEASVLAGLAPVVADLWSACAARRSAGGSEDPAPRPGAVAADDLATMAPPLPDALHEMSGIATTFLCRVHEVADTQEVLLAHRTAAGPDVTEGAAFAWTGSMCHLARAQGVSAVTDASARWPGSRVGVSLGLVTHATVPVELSDGTLCASDVVERAAALAAERVVLAFVDVDRFKAVNDVHGHAAGDAVLVELVARLRPAARPEDLVARLGGDELVVAAHLPRTALAALEDRVAAACAIDIVAVADARMYRHKARRARVGGAPSAGREQPTAPLRA